MPKNRLNKAFDSIRWDFLEDALATLNFPQFGIKWILECVLQPGFSIIINGKPCGFFNGTRGLRQGCPLSPYLFGIVMEFFSAVLIECVKNGLIPTPFVKGEVAVSHLLFADDVLIFASDSATAEVAGNLKRFLHDFSIHSGLSTNWGKSSIFFSNCTTESRPFLTFSRGAFQSNTWVYLYFLLD